MYKKLCIILAILFSSLAGLAAQEIQNFQPQAAVVSPEVTEDGVTFRLFADYASLVTLEGSWQVPGAKPIRLEKDRSGMWSITLKDIPADMHSYHFNVDGVRMIDPSNPMLQRDGEDYENVFTVEGFRTGNYIGNSGKHGSVTYEWYPSTIFGRPRRMAVYTPYGYNPNDTKKTYPVLYLLHGDGGDEESWISAGRAVQILDNMIQSGRAVPMIVVMPNGNPEKQAASSVRLPSTGYKYGPTSFVSSLVNEVIPYVEKNYRVTAKKASRAIAGTTMGGQQAFDAATLYPDRFDWYGFMSSGVEDSEHLQSDLMRIKKAGFKLLWEGCGTYDDIAYDRTKFLYDSFESLWMYSTLYIHNGGHDWKSWRLHLANYLSMVFQFYTDKR